MNKIKIEVVNRIKKKIPAVLPLLVLLSLSAAFLIFFYAPNGQAFTPFTPQPKPPATGNEYWDFDKGDYFSWEIKSYHNNTLADRNIQYFNVTDLVYEYNDYQSDYYYMVKLSEVFYNSSTNSLEEINSPGQYPTLNVSLINFTKAKMYPDDTAFIGKLNLFIPHNGAGLALTWCASALLNSVYNSLLGISPQFDIIGLKIHMYDSSGYSNSYVTLIYDNHGILETGEIFIDLGPFGNMALNYTRNYDLNPLDEIHWGVNIGDIYYFGINLNETKIEIVDIKNVTDGSYQSWSKVYANRWRWDFELEMWTPANLNMEIGNANEWLLSLGLVIPEGTSGEELHNQLLASDLPFEFSNYSDYSLFAINTTSGDFLDYHYFANGIMKYGYDYGVFEAYQNNLIFYNNQTSFTAGIQQIDFGVYNLKDYTINAKVDVTNDIELIFSGLPENPSDTPLENATFYFDLLVNDSSNINFPINITIKYNQNLKGQYRLWYYNLSIKTWEEIPLFDDKVSNLTASLNHTSIFGLTVVLEEIPNNGMQIDSTNKNDIKSNMKKSGGIPDPILFILFFFLICLAITVTAVSIYQFEKKKKIKKTAKSLKDVLKIAFNNKRLIKNLDKIEILGDLFQILNSFDIAVFSEEFLNKLEKFEWKEKDKREFLSEMVTFSERERIEIIDDMLEKSNLK